MLALLTLYPPPTFAPLSGESSFILSSYYVQQRSHGFGVSICGYIISARFAIQVLCGPRKIPIPFDHLSQIFATLFLGYIMKKLGARRIFLLSAAVTSIFNTTFFAVDLVSSEKLFLALSVTLICLTSLGDAGIFCSNYVLAAQQTKELRKSEESGALGPAIIETMYAAGGVLGPLLGE